MHQDTTRVVILKIKTTAAIQQIAGWVISVFFAFGVIGGCLNIESSFDAGMVVFCLIMTVVGAALIRSGHQKKKLVGLFHLYSSRLEADPTRSVDLVASSLGITTEVAMNDINQMLRFGLFHDMYIDDQRKCLIRKGVVQPFTGTSAPFPVAEEDKVIKCANCGAPNQVKHGAVAECEFCGSKIAGK